MEGASYLYSVHACEAWIKYGPARIRELQVLEKKVQDGSAIIEKARAAGVRIRIVGNELARADDLLVTEGWRAIVGPFPYGSLAELLDLQGPRIVVVLDHIMDPRNLGAIIRSTLAAGGAGVVIPKDRAAPVTATVEAASAGATACLKVVRVVNLVRALRDLKREGYWVLALEPREGQSLFSTVFPPRTALVVGGEPGLSRLVREAADQRITIPTDPRVESLNTSVAASIACFWWAKDYGPGLTA